MRDEVKENKRGEKLRTLSTLFFNMIASQKILLDGFTVEISKEVQEVKPGVSSIIHLENEIERMRAGGESNSAIGEFLEKVDSDDRIYGILRAFYVTVRIVTQKLSDENGFSIDERMDCLLTLINFTDFAQLRLVILAIQFLNYPIVDDLRKNVDFNAILEEVGLCLDPY